MSRPFTRDNHEKAHRRLNDMAYWLSKVTYQSALGVRAGSMQEGSGIPPSSICPEVMTPIPIMKTESAYNQQSPVVRRNIDSYYKIGNERYWTKITKGQREHFLSQIAKVLFI